MFFVLLHLMCFLTHAACYGLLAEHAHRVNPAQVYPYLILTAVSFIDLALAMRLLYRKWRRCQQRKRQEVEGK